MIFDAVVPTADSRRRPPGEFDSARSKLARSPFENGEGYGATHAPRLAANAMVRQLLKAKIYGQSKKHPNPDAREQLYGWWLGA